MAQTLPLCQGEQLGKKASHRQSRDGRPTSRTSMASSGSGRGHGGSSRYMGSIARKATEKGMILGFQPLNMVFQNICYSVDLPSVSPPRPPTPKIPPTYPPKYVLIDIIFLAPITDSTSPSSLLAKVKAEAALKVLHCEAVVCHSIFRARLVVV